MTPHPVLPNRYTAPEERPGYVKNLFNEGAEHYDPVVGWGFWGTGNMYRKDAQRRNGLKPGMQLLDVACGTGLMAVAAKEVLGGDETITCVEPSDGMLAVARKKLNARFIQSGAESMPLPEASFDFLTVGYALRHFADLEATFREFHRVLKPGGKVLILEATRPAGKFGSWLFKLYFGRIYPFFVRILTRSQKAEEMMVYFWETMDACVRPEDVLKALQAAGFEKCGRKPVLGWFSEYTAVK
ncbi:MAG: class I SAM-dependent methyltransferase [Verrucomicrobiaceae bacterium]|nr:class I SAM-dependent methyltransferase [Verrucomicrobiaceae bacterium]